MNMNRTHNNGELRLENVGQTVELKGWVAKKRNLGALVFIDLRDRYGITQIIVNEEMGYGIYSYERQTPYEEAQSTLNTYQASYDAAEEELKKATLQSRMDDYAMQMYDISDSCLNEIWNLVKYNTSEEKFNEILTEQRKWIADKEAAGNEILDQNDGSSAQMDSSLKMAELTMERCEELADYLK